MRTLGIISVLLGVLLVIGYGIAWAADEDSETHTSGISLTVPHAAKLEIDKANPSKTLVRDGTAETAFDAGYVEMDAAYPTLTIRANKNWKLFAKSSGFGEVSGYVKAITDLELKDAGSIHVTMGSFTGLTAADQEVATSTVGVKDESHPCQYKILLDYTKDIPGTYTATVTYTLATQA